MGHPKRKYDLMVLRGGPPFYVLRVDTQVSNCNIRMIDFSITLPYCQLRRPTPKDNFFDSHGMYCIVQKKSINAQIAHDSLMVFNQDAILTNLRWTE